MERGDSGQSCGGGGAVSAEGGDVVIVFQSHFNAVGRFWGKFVCG